MKRILIILLLVFASCSNNEQIEFDCICRIATFEVATEIVRVAPEVLDGKCNEQDKWFNRQYDSNGGLTHYSYLICEPK